ncbi:MAG: M43 family zinc metalloprotease [Bacteroidota bacterium]
MKKVIILFTAFLSVLNVKSQEIQETRKPCGHAMVTNELWKKNPQAEIEYKNSIQRLLKSAKKNSKTNTLTIPIVFHIIHQYGTENISDAQVFDQVAILNRDFRALNEDTTLIATAFENLVADCNIEFRLPTIDYKGDCTNGIEHVNSHETKIGNDNSKYNQWDRNKYLNVWVVQSMKEGTAGYAYYPQSIDNGLAFADGIIILDGHIGRIGTGSENNSRSLTHEIGHYLGLSHVWGSNNDPGQGCGDDGFDDTPVTKGWTICPTPNASRVCVPPVNGVGGIVENYNNYMDYSYCSFMFTPEQAALMYSTLASEEALRDILVNDQNHIETGIFANPAPTCTPIADFGVSSVPPQFGQQVSDPSYPGVLTTCIGENVYFNDFSWNSVIISRLWSFQDGTTTDLTVANPVVTFSSGGWKRVTLTVNNGFTTNTLDIEKYIYISDDVATHNGPFSDDLNGDVSNWIISNPEGNEAQFIHTPNQGKLNTAGFKLTNFYIPPGTGSDYEQYYMSRLGGNKDAIISPSYDLSGATHINLNFDYAYATQGTQAAEITEELRVYTSRNCGKTWTLKRTLSGAELLTAGNFTSNFNPTSAGQWKNCSFDFFTGPSDTKTRVKFEFYSSDVSNNLYIDNVNLSGTLFAKENLLNALDLTIFPNPINKNEQLNISYLANDKGLEFELLNVNNQVIAKKAINLTNQTVEFNLLENTTVAAGCYFVKVRQGDFIRVEKVIIQ